MGDELMTAAVELTSITKRFGDVTAVDHVDLAIADGEFFAMLGPSGCGKSTLISALSQRLRRPARLSGDIYVNGKRGNVPRHLVGFVPQDDIVCDRITVRRP